MSFETRLTPETIDRYTASGHWGSETLHHILTRQASRHPDRVAIVDRGTNVTYAELAERVDRVAAHLGALGIGRGDVVTIQLPNWAAFAYVFFAAERIGAVANQIGPDFRSREVEYIIRFSESRAFVCPAVFKTFDYVAMIQELRPAAARPAGGGRPRGRRTSRRHGVARRRSSTAPRRPAAAPAPDGRQRRHAHGVHLGHDRQSRRA